MPLTTYDYLKYVNRQPTFVATNVRQYSGYIILYTILIGYGFYQGASVPQWHLINGVKQKAYGFHKIFW